MRIYHTVGRVSRSSRLFQEANLVLGLKGLKQGDERVLLFEVAYCFRITVE